MNYISLICLLAFLLLSMTFFKKGTDILSPGRLFTLVWLLAIGLTELKLSRFQQTWSSYSWFTLMVPLVSFVLGIFIVFVINNNKELIGVKRIRDSFNDSQIDTKMLVLVIVVIFALYSISYITTYTMRGFLPVFAKSPEVARMHWGVKGYGTFVLVIPTLLYLCILYLFLVKKKMLRKLVVAAIFIAAAVTYSMLLNRFYLIVTIVISIVTIYYKTNKLSTKNIVILASILIAVFLGISTIRLSKVAINVIYVFARMKYGPDYAVFTEPYMYITMNLENYAHAVSKLTVFTHGFFTSDFLLYATGLKETIAKYINPVEYPYIITKGYNTYTMFFIYYQDFGLFGVLIIPAILGGVISNIYYRMRRNPTISNVSIYGLCVFIILFSFFIPILHLIHFVFNVVLIYLSTWLVERRIKTD